MLQPDPQPSFYAAFKVPTKENAALGKVINSDTMCFPNFRFYTQSNGKSVTANKNETFVHFLLAIETDDNYKESVRSPVRLSTMLLKATSLYFRPTILCKERTNYSE